jgi:heat shock protein HslJ
MSEEARGSVGEHDLLDVVWRLTGMIGDSEAFIPVLGDVVITALFDDQDRVSGGSGCNRYTGPATFSGAGLRIGAVAGTRMMCSDPLVMAQESRYLGLLARVGSYRTTLGANGRTAELFDGEGVRILEFEDSL